jgi:signal transduction protein with GAF and PtsI domain
MQIQELKTQAYDIIVEIERARMYIEDKQKVLQKISDQINEEEKKALQKNTGSNPPKKA